MPHQLEVVPPEPSSPSLLDERQPAAARALVYGNGTNAEQVGSVSTREPVTLGIRRLEPHRAHSRWLLRRSGTLLALGPELAWSRSSDARPLRPREVSSPFATSFATSDTWQPRISAASAWVIHTGSTLGGLRLPLGGVVGASRIALESLLELGCQGRDLGGEEHASADEAD
jgi:hypothetical protein